MSETWEIKKKIQTLRVTTFFPATEAKRSGNGHPVAVACRRCEICERRLNMTLYAEDP